MVVTVKESITFTRQRGKPMPWIALLALTCVAPVGAQAPHVQTDWSGGAGTQGPVQPWGNRFQASDDVAWRPLAGQIALRSTPRPAPLQNVIAGDAGHPKSVAVGDIDGDGVNDIVSPQPVTDISNDLGAVYWWRRQANGTWAQQVVDGDFYGAWYVDTTDLDGDGDVDVIASAYFGIDPDDPDGLGINGRFAWFENLAGDGSSWEQHVVGGFFHGARYIDAGDLDGDGDIDLAGASELTGGVGEQDADIAWFENLDGEGDTWAAHELETHAGSGWEVHIADIDSDGALDIVSCEDGRVAWFDNANGDGSLWLKRTVSANLNSLTYADIGDVDNDGDLDIIGGSYQTAQIGWWENTAGTGSVWFPRYVVDGSFGLAIELGDVEGDGDLDALFTKQTGGSSGAVYWIENTTGDGGIWSPRLISLGFQSRPRATFADANTDGRLDAVCSDEDFAGNDARQLCWFDLTQYVPNGDLISSVLDAGGSPGWETIEWEVAENADTNLAVQVRASNNPSNLGPFMTADSSGQNLADLVDVEARYLQYRLLLDTTDVDSSPVFKELTLETRANGDADDDGDVDTTDFARFNDCMANPGETPDPPPPMTSDGCLDGFDFDNDADVDFHDYASFSLVFTGA